LSNLPLAFAEILIGGIIVTAGITGDSFSNIIKGEISPQPLAGSSTSILGAGGGSSTTAAGASTAYGSLVGADGITPTNFATALLNAIGAPLTKANIQSIVDWEAQEGGAFKNNAAYNPLNTTQAEPGYTVTGSQGNIGSYRSWSQGLQATVTTLENGSYNDLLDALRSGQGLMSGSYQGLSTWSHGSYSTIGGAP
jgi:hypothetical protein